MAKAKTTTNKGVKIEMLKIADLHPYENNPRINEMAVDYVKESIAKFGFKIPIVIDEEYVILAGHTRLMAAQELKMKNVPCIIARGLTDEQKRAYRIADNRAGELTEFDFEKVNSELGAISLEAPELDMDALGFEQTKARAGEEKVLKAKDADGNEVIYCPRCGRVVKGSEA